MAAAIVIVVMIAAGGQPQATTPALSRSLEEALPQGALVLVREGATTTDDEIANVSSKLHADAVAVVVWSDVESSHATLRVHRPSTGAVVAREMDFRPADATPDRGRAVGFAIASMMPPVSDEPPRAPPIAPPPSAPVAPAEMPAPALAAPDRRWGIDLLFAVTGGVGGDAGGFGGALGLRYLVADRFDVRGAVSVTQGSFPSVGGSLTLVKPTVGMGWQALRTERATISPRVELGPWHHAVSRSGDGVTEGSRWIFGMTFALEGAWRVFDRLDIVATGGVDVALGNTRVFVGAEERTSIPVTRLVGSSGLRIAF
jgi:hypothetical protein